MTGEHIVLAALEEGCPAAGGWVEFFDHLTLPLAGQELAEAQAIVADRDDPASPQSGLGDC
jgi:hypothetical protein